MAIETERLTLLPFSARHVLALMEGEEQFATAFGIPVATELRGFYLSDDVSPAWLEQLRSNPGEEPWTYGFAVVERAEARVIGSAGFKGAPDEEGVVEIAYGVVPSREGRGFATEAAAALVAFALGDPRVRSVRAHTLAERNASTRVLAKCGFRFVGDVMDPEDGPVWRWERQRVVA